MSVLRSLLILLLVGCSLEQGMPDMMPDVCRWQRDEVIEIEWTDGGDSSCRRVCASFPTYTVTTVTSTEVADYCEGWRCYPFFAEQGEQVQFWSDPMHSPFGSISSSEWWFDVCTPFEIENRSVDYDTAAKRH